MSMANDVFIQTLPDDPLIAPVIEGLFGEYRQRYGDYFGDQEQESLDLYAPPQGAFIVLLRGGAPIAMGAFKRYDPQTAELKRIWTRSDLRRQGLAQRVLQQLETLALGQGYRQLYLTTGFRQPEAVGLYLNNGYQPQFDPSIDSEIYSRPPYDGRLPFRKNLITEDALCCASERKIA
ncbi:Predicted acetyltransferase [Serratia ficaria]|nr:Predicted acetyltransferase [Serratia ficaria]